MKTNKTVSTLLTCLFFLSLSLKGYTQKKDPYQYCTNKKAAKELDNAFDNMHKTTTIVTKIKGKTCSAEDLIKKVGSGTIAVFPTSLAQAIDGLYLTIRAPRTSETIDKGFFMTLEDKAFNALKKSKNFIEFVTNYTGKNIGDLNGSITSGGGLVTKDIDNIRRYYNTLKRLFNGLEFNVSYDQSRDQNCRTSAKSTLKIAKFSYPNVTWHLSTHVSVNCVCNNGLDTKEVKSGSFEYTATSIGKFTYSDMTFGVPKDSKITVLSLECCGQSNTEKPISSEPKTEEIQNLMPDQSIGGGAGFGATQDFENISYCVFAEYLKKINYGSDNGLYWGAEASYSNSSFNDASTNRFNVGTKLQYHIPATPSQQTQFVAGIMGSYNFGTNDNGFSKDDVSGIIACAYGGVNIRVCEDWSVFGQFPILIYETFTFKSESGGEFKTDGTSVLLNKNNPLKLGIRFHF